MHLALALCMYFVMTCTYPFSSQLLGEIRLNKIALAAWIPLNPTLDGIDALLDSYGCTIFTFEMVHGHVEYGPRALT